jgi:uncharacterized membrane protein (DUF2068 family)
LIALERFVRGVLLLAAGAYLVTHLGSDLGRLADRAMRALELDPRRPFLHRIIGKLHRLHAGTVLVTGLAALGYGLLEVVEGVGLWLDRLWAEYLTVIATSLLIPLSSTSWRESQASSRQVASLSTWPSSPTSAGIFVSESRAKITLLDDARVWPWRAGCVCRLPPVTGD